jgi:hypothetical protein
VSRLVPRNQSGKLSGQLQDAVSQDPGKPPENPKFGCFPRFLGIGGLEGSWDGRGRPGAQFLIVYILVSSKPALQNPVILVFGMGVAKTARKTANSGQFSATFYGLFPDPHFFTKFVTFHVLEHVFSLFVKSRKSELQTPNSQVPGNGWFGAVWSSFPGPAPDWGLGRGLGGSLGSSLEQLPRSCSRLPPDCHQTATRLRHRFGVCHQTDLTWRKSVLPRSQAGC